MYRVLTPTAGTRTFLSSFCQEEWVPVPAASLFSLPSTLRWSLLASFLPPPASHSLNLATPSPSPFTHFPSPFASPPAPTHARLFLPFSTSRESTTIVAQRISPPGQESSDPKQARRPPDLGHQSRVAQCHGLARSIRACAPDFLHKPSFEVLVLGHLRRRHGAPFVPTTLLFGHF